MNNQKYRTGLAFVFIAIALVVLTGVVLTQSSSAGGQPLQGGPGITMAPPNEIQNPPSGEINGVPDITSTVTLAYWRNLRPTEHYLHSVSLLPASYDLDCISPDQKSRGWAVGNGGVILNYCNGIWDHAIVVESIPTDLYSVQAISPTLGVAVGDQGAILLYLYDRIALDWVWTKSPIPVGNLLLTSVSMTPDGTGNYVGWAVGAADSLNHGTLIRGTISPGMLVNGHQTYNYSWENVTSDFTEPDFPEVDSYYAVQMLSPNNGWAVGGKDVTSGVILHWNGSKWSVAYETSDYPFLGLHMNTANDGWAVGQGGIIYHYDGSSWSQVNSPTQETLTDVDFAPNGEGWIVGYDGTLLKHQPGAWNIGWTVFTDLRTDRFDFRSVDFTSGHGWLVGLQFRTLMGGEILEYDDGLWLAVTPPTDNRLNEVSTVDDNDAWAVGVADELGGTIIHWDGKHWQRWYQKDLPIPAQDLYTIDMVSATDGWAGGEVSDTGASALLLHWDGYRWAPPRYDAPLNVRINDLSMLDSDFGWAVADMGNGVAKYDGYTGYWSANHTCYGTYYQSRAVDIVPSSNPTFGWDAWAVGSHYWVDGETRYNEVFLKYQYGCADGYAWDVYDVPNLPPPPTATPRPFPTPTVTPKPSPTPANGGKGTCLYGLDMVSESEGYAVGSYTTISKPFCFDCGFGDQKRDTNERAVVHYFNGATWDVLFAQLKDTAMIYPSAFCSVSVVNESKVAWFAGYYTYNTDWKYAFIEYIDSQGYGWAGIPLPLNGRGWYHRPIKSIDMVSDTMGWAVGDPEIDHEVPTRRVSVMYQYPFPNFTLEGIPSGRAVLPGETTTYNIKINTPLGGFNANVGLTLIGGLPPGATYTLTPDNITPDEQAVLSITTSPSTPLGVYHISLQGYSHYRSGDVWFDAYRTMRIDLTVTNTPIYSVDPTHGPAGTLVTITGTGFGSSRSPSDYVVMAGEQMPASAIVSWSNTQIEVRVPDDTSLFPHGPQVGIVKVWASGSASNTDINFQLENTLTGISYEKIDDKIRVTLTGTSLGLNPGSVARSTTYEHITLGSSWIPNVDVISWSNNSIVFEVPITTRAAPVTVTSNGFESNALYYNPFALLYLPVTVRP